ncbi:MAG: MBOAT family protein [Eubacteriales bacterium]|nr:MBOAT family protein [Eubacteriales bacterium]
MSFYSVNFLLFFLAATALVQLAKTPKAQRWVFLLANAVFYAYWDVRFLLLLLGVIGACYAAGRLFERNAKPAFIYLGVTACLALLGFCKYYNFFVSSFAGAFGLEAGTLNIILPLGISFYLFQAMSYLLDVKKGTVPAERDFVKLAAYISFFPQITSGPIVKAHDFLPQLERLHRVKKDNVYLGITRFLTGLTKKVVFADRIGVAVNAVFAAPAAYNGLSIAMAVIGYSLQIYCDFSGYSDMAIGIATVWDFDLGKNFNMPYLAENSSDFWRRWHISLSSWFRDYVYIPLGGSRRGKFKTYVNLFLTMLLSGLWHGANGTYLVWGAYHGAGCVVHRLFGKRVGQKTPWKAALCTAANCLFVSVGWVIFRAETMAQAMEVFRGLFRGMGVCYVNVFVVVYGLVISLTHLYARFRWGGSAPEYALKLDKFSGKLTLCVWVFLIAMLMYCGNSAFIYANF